MENLIIAEKKTTAIAIAQNLGGTVQDRRDHFEVQTPDTLYHITWCSGHLLRLAEPGGYGEEYQYPNFDYLPIIPQKWLLVPVERSVSQLNAIGRLLRTCTQVTHAGDADREGQLIVDEVLLYFGNRKPVKRLWFSALDDISVRRALTKIKDNKEYYGLCQSALVRSWVDWLVGMNLSRAYGLAARKHGYAGKFSLGRVQTPTLRLIVERNLEIENFVPKNFYEVVASIAACDSEKNFQATWVHAKSEGLTLDSEGRLLDRSVALKLSSTILNEEGVITDYAVKQSQLHAPPPFNLSRLQALANKKYKVSAANTLKIVQTLYLSKLVTYPRTDCSYLPEAQFADAPSILEKLSTRFPHLTENANTSLKSSSWNDAKVTSHHAIIPTGEEHNLSGLELQIYELIVKGYVSQFYPPCRVEEILIELKIKGHTFQAQSRITKSLGWKAINGGLTEEEKTSPQLPTVSIGDRVTCTAAEPKSRKTSPPAYFTQGTLIMAMGKIHQHIDDSDFEAILPNLASRGTELKDVLRSSAGLGTEATRSTIIETLIDRGFVFEQKGGSLDTPPFARELIAKLPVKIKSPLFTALNEQQLEAIVTKPELAGSVLAQQIHYVEEQVALARNYDLRLSGSPQTQSKTAQPQKSVKKKTRAKSKKTAGSSAEAEVEKCPKCGGKLLSRRGASGDFKGCSGYPECRYTQPIK